MSHREVFLPLCSWKKTEWAGFDWGMIVAARRSKNQPIYLYFPQNMTMANRKTNAEVATPIHRPDTALHLRMPQFNITC